jgi:hypothetical protein
MSNEMKTRLVRLVDFTAEALEQEADGIPNSDEALADTLRTMAKMFRQKDNPRMIRVWEEEEEGPMSIEELKEKAKARGYTRIKRDAEYAVVVHVEGWLGFSSLVSGGLNTAVNYYLVGNRVRVEKALEETDHWYVLS